MRRPLVWCMMCFIPGVVTGRVWLPELSDLWMALGLAIAILAVARPGAGRGLVRASVGSVCFLAGWTVVGMHHQVDPDWGQIPEGLASDVKARGQIISEPELRISKNKKPYYVFDAALESYGVRRADEQPASGVARVSAFGMRGASEPAYGDVWEFSGALTRFAPEHAFEEGRLLLFVRGWQSRRIDDEQGARFKGYCIRARQAAAEVLSSERDDRSESVMRALVLGYSGDLDKKTRTLFSDSGTLHIFAISGLHVGIAAVVLIFLFKLAGVPRPYWGLVLAPFLIGYIVMTGAKVSAIRAS